MVNSWPRNTKKETEEKTTERTISTCTDWSHSGKNKSSPDFSCHQVQSCILCFSFLYHFLWRTRTTKFPWSCQTCSCTTGPSSPDLPTPTRTGKRNETMQGTADTLIWTDITCQTPITTFSMVAINNIARVIRCSRITNMSRYAIFDFLK